MIIKFVRIILLAIFSTTNISPVMAQGVNSIALPPVGSMVHLSSSWQPPLLKGVTINPNNPLEFKFIIDPGNDLLLEKNVHDKANNLIKYFLAALTTPEQHMWVNLAPHEENKIVNAKFGTTFMGRDLLAQDYLLKQLTASLMHPDSDIGKHYWGQIYEKVYSSLGAVDIPRDTFHKVWIYPDDVEIFEQGQTAFITKAYLKVALEDEYFNQNISSEKSLSTEVMKEVVLPAIEKEINEGKNFAILRQVYHSIILATWFKKRLKSSLLYKTYANQQKMVGVDDNDFKTNKSIYDQYTQAFKKGVYHLIKEEYDPIIDDVVPRKYFSGGTSTKNPEGILLEDRMRIVDSAMASKLIHLLSKFLVVVTGFYIPRHSMHKPKPTDLTVAQQTLIENRRQIMHDIRNPMGLAYGYAETIEEVMEGRAKEYVSDLKKVVSEVTEDVTNFSEIVLLSSVEGDTKENLEFISRYKTFLKSLQVRHEEFLEVLGETYSRVSIKYREENRENVLKFLEAIERQMGFVVSEVTNAINPNLVVGRYNLRHTVENVFAMTENLLSEAGYASPLVDIKLLPYEGLSGGRLIHYGDEAKILLVLGNIMRNATEAIDDKKFGGIYFKYLKIKKQLKAKIQLWEEKEGELKANFPKKLKELESEMSNLGVQEEKIKQELYSFIQNHYDGEVTQGEIIIKVKEEVIQEGKAQGEVYAVITVEDNGGGAELEDLTRIMDSEQDLTTKDYGNGIGFNSANSIVRRHGGDIFIENREKNGERIGARVTIRLPLTRKGIFVQAFPEDVKGLLEDRAKRRESFDPEVVQNILLGEFVAKTDDSYRNVRKLLRANGASKGIAGMQLDYRVHLYNWMKDGEIHFGVRRPMTNHELEDRLSIKVNGVIKDANLVHDDAMSSKSLNSSPARKGGVDFKYIDRNLLINEDKAMTTGFNDFSLEELDSAPGFVPVIYDIQPNVPLMLHISKNTLSDRLKI